MKLLKYGEDLFDKLPAVIDSTGNYVWNALSIWENQLITNVITNSFQSILLNELNQRNENDQKKNEFILSNEINELIQKYLMCMKITEFVELKKLWTHKYFHNNRDNFPILLFELINRSILRILTRKLGIYDITVSKDNQHIIMKSNEINHEKWNRILLPIIDDEMKLLCRFQTTQITSKTASEKEGSGIIMFKTNESNESIVSYNLVIFLKSLIFMFFFIIAENNFQVFNSVGQRSRNNAG